ncbi:MAG: S53 family peptidase [Planctomycetes bacterium]|nr:S53 family peptidase [Planctomycetota bacterium]
MKPLSRPAVRRVHRILLSIERLEDRLVPGETMGAMLLFAAGPAADGAVPAQELMLDDSLPVSTDCLALPADGDAFAVPIATVQTIQDGEQRAETPSDRDTSPGAGEQGLDLLPSTEEALWAALPRTTLSGSFGDFFATAPLGAASANAPALFPGVPGSSAPGRADGPSATIPPSTSQAGPAAVPEAAPAVGGTAEPLLHVKAQSSTGPNGYSRDQIRHAYHLDQISADGTGQTIAIVDAYNAPKILSDVRTFNTQFGLPQFNTNTPGDPTLKVVNQTGGSNLPRTDAGWALEISLDVEWAHAIAPKANILLVEARSNSFSNLFAAVDYAAAHAQVVSMSWGGSEFSSESAYDYHFNKTGVTFTAASGDWGTGVIYPAASPNVVAVGGTTLPLDSSGNLLPGSSETAWSGSGGGISAYESEPPYQSTFANTSKRGVPDVSYDADPATGFSVYDSTSYYGQSGWFVVGGTSAGAPQWAALVALANEGRSTPLSSNSLASSPVYSAAGSAVYASNYRDITAGSNGSGPNTTATTGYDFVTGLGSPLADGIVPYLHSL